MKTHDQLIEKWRRDPAFRAEYDALADEFALFDELLNARLAAKLTQAEVAERMQTRVPAISRLESAGGRHLHSPSLTTLRTYAEAVDCRLVVKLEPLPEQAPRVAERKAAYRVVSKPERVSGKSKPADASASLGQRRGNRKTWLSRPLAERDRPSIRPCRARAAHPPLSELWRR